MTINEDRFTKFERKELRRLSGIAYERELAGALASLDDHFSQWRKQKITALEMSEHIHKFHNGIARGLWSFYSCRNNAMIVAQAVLNGIVSKAEIKGGVLEKLRLL